MAKPTQGGREVKRFNHKSEMKLAVFHIQVPDSALGNLARYSKRKLVTSIYNDANSNLKTP